MSKMGLLGAIGFSLTLVSLTQILDSAEGCKILSATATTASSILVKWELHPGATSYLIDLRKKDSPGSVPVVTSAPGQWTMKDIKGLSPGTEYIVTLKVFIFYFVECVTSTEASTVPDTSHILEGRALTSTSIFLKWEAEDSAEYYHLEVSSQATGDMLSFTYTNTSAVVENLQPSTDYDCYIYTANQAGWGGRSKVRTITTLVQPPVGITATQVAQGSVKIAWQPVEDVLLYQVRVWDLDEPYSQSSVHNVSGTWLDVQGILPCSDYLISVSSFSKFLVPSEGTNHTYTTNKLTPVSTVSVDYSCTANSVRVSWSPVFGADSYKASAVGANGTWMMCMSPGTSCHIYGLTCGQDYVVHVTPMSENCENVVNATSATFHTVPCPPGDLTLVRECSKDVISFSWTPTENADHYFAQAVDSTGRVHPCLTQDNFCNFTRVVCGRHYDFTVYSISGQCKSNTSSTVGIRTAPCIPQNLRTSANCSTDVLLSTWDLAEGALTYIVNAVGNRRNSSYSCKSLSNSCAMEGVQCGEHLSINITAYDDECPSPPSLGLSAETVPCAPHKVVAEKECGTDSISVTWKIHGSALFYVAMAKDVHGALHSCNSMGSGCKIHGMKCSMHYDVYVIASNFMCNSTESDVVTIETAPCPPDTLIASLDCEANEALISWRGEPKMNSYTATIVDDDHGLLSCSSTTTNCKIPNLKCSKLYTVTVSYHDGVCPSMPSEPIYIDSVPCGPADLHADVDCESGGMALTWSDSTDSEGFITVISGGSAEMTYNSTEPELSVSSLECGTEYTVRVMSYNDSCVSLSSEITVWEAPCVPTDVTTNRNCSQSFVDVMWAESRGARNYSAIAVDGEGNRKECVSGGTWCRIEEITCSQVYDVSVAAVDETCTSKWSPAVKLQTEPCPPSELVASMDCSSNSAALSWSSSPNAVSYTGWAVSTNGHSMSCGPGTALGCNMEDLHCGEEYTFTVTASDDDCQSAVSKPVVLATAPCVVEDVMTSLNCSTNVLTVEWTPGSMPVNYSVVATASDGTERSWSTEDSGSWLPRLECGKQYTVTVTPISSTCEGPSSEPEIVNAVPCVPMDVQGMVECSTNTLHATWAPAGGAVSYISTLTDAGGSSVSCPTPDQSCLFPALECAQTYTFSVVAINDRCGSPESAVISATTAPCDPTKVSASLDCASGVATVSWMASAGADHYTVVAKAGGKVDSCNSTGDSCKLTHLHCGENYTVTVLAGDSKCNSSMLARTNITTAPCAPVIQDHSLDCATNHATVTWAEDEDALRVTVTATSSFGHTQSCGSSTNPSCVLDDLQCGHTYTVEAVAQGVKCSSKASTSFQIIAAPCTPLNVAVDYSCGTGVAIIYWDETLGRERFYVYADAGDQMPACNTTETYCSMSSLHCSRLYDIKVIAVAKHCNSSVPAVAKIQTAPCAPVNMGATLVCENNTAEVTWDPSPYAMTYNVMAYGQDGDIKRCSTNGTQCWLPDMHCAVIYILTVTPFSNNCEGQESESYRYVAGPCPPTKVGVALQCVGNVGHVSWNAALQADHYEATTVTSGVDGYSHNCSSTGDGCSFTDLHCGETVTVTVVTIERGCRSRPSVPVTFQSVICPPTGLTGVTTCGNNDITVSWDPSPESGVEYYVHSREDGGAVANFSTTQTSHTMTGLQCGQMYTLTVAATDSECTSIFSEQIHTDTAPCPPTDLTVKTECGTNMATLDWAPSTYAMSYTAMVTGTHGHVASCSTNSTLNCSMSVDCGHQYTGVVVASSDTCDSNASAPLTFDSAPCLPDRVQAEMDCNANSFAVQWRGSIGDVGTYTALAIGSDGTRESCDSPTTDCTIEDLKCGLTYGIVVTTSSVDCGVIEGSNYKMQSAPCKPDNVLVDLQCSTNEAFVTWGNSGPDQTHEVTALDSRGIITNCYSNSSNCTFDQLTCGLRYTVSVVGHTDTCSSDPTIEVEVHTAPCVPTHLTASVDCDARIVAVTWDSALGAQSYTVYARGSLGYNDSYTTTDTNHHFSNLACGQDYNITVVARHDSCVSLVSETISASTGPCPHGILKPKLECETNTVLVSWTPGSGILSYTATADAFGVQHVRTCSTPDLSCNITSLRCGQDYQVSVSGQGLMCPSPAQDWHRINTAPCPPTQLKVVSTCDSNNISVSWQASQGSISYMAMAENAEGRQWSCRTGGTGCQISSLLCGQKYNVYVVGLNEDCVGAKSDVKIMHTAPCVPEDIQNKLDCLTDVLNVTWESTGHYVRFLASVASSEGHVGFCNTSEHHCVVPNMQCGLTYDVTVVAEDETCNSTHSPLKQVPAAPCPLPSFMADVDCGTGVVAITWSDSVEGVTYTVWATDASGRRHNCSGTDVGCDLSDLECGTDYSVTITPSRDGCIGRNSPTKLITTVPCVPRLSDVEIDCLTNSAWVMFDESSGAENYVVVVSDTQGDIKMFECNTTSDGTCSLPPLACSQNLTFTLKAQDQQCHSAPSTAITAETAPCAPEHVTESVNCDNSTISIAWSPVPGAVYYTATLEEIPGGNTTCCMSPGTGCDISHLPCGQMYTLYVMAEGRTCNSSQSEAVMTRTVACVPEDLTSTVSCSNNVASMSWSHSKGGQMYTVTAVAADGHEHECMSPTDQCDLIDLHCGEFYTATVTAEDTKCRSKPSHSVTLKTVPCTPENTSAVMDCETNSLVVSWSESAGADSYTATLQDSLGQTTTCLGTTEGHCSVKGVGCGQLYHVQVVSSDGVCDSPPTLEMTTPTAPCSSRNIMAEMDCATRTAVVSWHQSSGASSYVVTATPALGLIVVCETNTTSCELEALLCGQTYSVSVNAIGETCSFVTDMTGELITEPCIPGSITTQYSITIGQVQWDVTLGAEYYDVLAETEQGLTTSCRTADTYCALYNMKCGQTYNITVTANNRVCQNVSTSTEEVSITTEPCPPKSVDTSVNCQENLGTVSWEASWGAVGYVAHLAGRNGHSLSCYTADTYCTVEDLHCGVIYHTSVIAVGPRLNSSSSTTVPLVSAPCASVDVTAELDCDNNTAMVSWSSASGANSYTVSAASEDGYRDWCESEGLWCELTELMCGQVYNVTLMTNSDTCLTETDSDLTISTRPCKPMRVGADLQCGTRTANMYWEEQEGVELYVATATCSTGTPKLCNSTGSTCQFTDLHCGETYELYVTAYSNMCDSEVSSTVEIQTEPCQPTGLTVNGTCNNDTVELDWSEAKGALLYVVTATGDLGHTASYQTTWTSMEADLPCGQLFTFTVQAQDDRCDSAVSLPEQYKTGPCVPEHVHSFIECEDSLGAVSWAMSAGAESYLAVAVGLDGHTHECTSNTTDCTWDDLHCGEQYTIHVIANDYLCTSLPSDSTSLRMAPCKPQNLISSLNCSTKVGSLTWDSSETAEYYIVTAESDSGHKVELSTSDTWTFISEFECGHSYSLSVQAADSECTSLSSQPSVLDSVPCPPTGVSSYMNCVADIAIVSWTASAGAEFYTATVSTEDGWSKSCWSDGEHCSMANIVCGQNFTVTVVASNNKCDSDPSEEDTLLSVPCIPTDVEVELDCTTNEAVVSWNMSDGALSYKAVAESTRGAKSYCETSNLGCTLKNITCGHNYTVQVVAEDDICSSLPSPPVLFNSVPCSPNIGTVVLDCYTNSALLDWEYAEGAVSYTAMARSPAGHVANCTTNATNCEMKKLQCGQTYSVFTVASNGGCNSQPSSSLEVTSVPCPPEDVVPVVDCANNTAWVTWQPSAGAESYIVQALGVQEHETYCETNSSNCLLPDLMCGFSYSVSVTAVNSVCNVSRSAIKNMQAVPCVPQHVEARVVCESGGVAVSWEWSQGASSYSAVAQGTGGYASVCYSNDTTCLFSDLMCGYDYSITVSGLDDTCSSAASDAVEISTVPCVPQSLTAEMVCSTDTGMISWEEGEGVSSHMVQAVGPDGHKLEHQCSGNSCELPGMHCGQRYNVTVTAQDGRCDNSRAHLTLQSVPCTPTSVKASLRCRSNSAAVTWEPASGAHSYLAVGVTADGSHRVTCNNSLTFCDMSDLRCGQTYTVSVFAQDDSCSSVESNRTSVRTAPCEPQNVAVDAQCAEKRMVVSWSPDPDVQYFHAAAVSNTGARLYCNSTGTGCAMGNLSCGHSYNVTVLAVRDDCESKMSPPVETSSAPCVPRNAYGRLDCVTNSAWVTWDESLGATSYFVLAQAANGLSSNCTSPSSPCNVPDLECGTLYVFYVMASNQHCSSNHSDTFELETGPCALRSIMATTECNSDTIVVEWEQTLDMPLYLVTAEAEDQTLISCNSTTNTCVLEDIRCGMHYSIIVSASSDKCSSLRSPPKKIKTAPCVPDNVIVEAICEDNGVTVGWAHSSVATSYQLIATGWNGHVVSCNSPVNNCSLADLHCGQTYDIILTAAGDDCTSHPGTYSFTTVPCSPAGLAVNLDCETNSASLSWDASEGAVEYFSCAQPAEGPALYCNNTELSCIFEGLECGEMYNFSVTASDGFCNSSFSAPMLAGAAPCPPAQVNVRLQKIATMYWAMVSWDEVNCSDVEYLMEVTGRLNNSDQTLMMVSSYWLPRPYFELPIPCSTAFNVTVKSKNSGGASEPSSPVSRITPPCPPENVVYRGGAQLAVLSWDASALATNYTVYNVSDGGIRVQLCSTTTEHFCKLTNFDPDVIQVTASNAAGESCPAPHIKPALLVGRRRRDLRAAHVYSHIE